MQPNQTLTGNPAKDKATETTSLLQRIKKSSRDKAPVTLWLAYRYASPKEPSPTPEEKTTLEAQPEEQTILYHRVRRLEIDKKLADKLRGILNNTIEKANRLEEYTFEGAVENETALYEETSTTEFASILKLITDADEKKDVVEKEIQLHRAYGYVIQIEPKDVKPIYAFRKLSTSWKARKLNGLINAMLRDKVLVSFDDENIFRFDARLDFFASEDYVFILEKTNFESSLHFRKGMERKRDSLLSSLEKTGLYVGLEFLQELSKSHVRWLKKLAGAYNHGKCIKPEWVDSVIACSEKKEWPVNKADGKLQITKANCERVLRLMNDDLLESPVDQTLFNIDGAKQPTK